MEVMTARIRGSAVETMKKGDGSSVQWSRLKWVCGPKPLLVSNIISRTQTFTWERIENSS